MHVSFASTLGVENYLHGCMTKKKYPIMTWKMDEIRFKCCFL